MCVDGAVSAQAAAINEEKLASACAFSRTAQDRARPCQLHALAKYELRDDKAKVVAPHLTT